MPSLRLSNGGLGVVIYRAGAVLLSPTVTPSLQEHVPMYTSGSTVTFQQSPAWLSLKPTKSMTHTTTMQPPCHTVTLAMPSDHGTDPNCLHNVL